MATATRRRRSLVPALLATLALAATIAGAALTIHEANRDSSRRQEPIAFSNSQPTFWTYSSQGTAPVLIAKRAAAERAHVQARLVELSDIEGTNDHSNTLGLVLLIGGLAALVPLTLFGLGRTALDR